MVSGRLRPLRFMGRNGGATAPSTRPVGRRRGSGSSFGGAQPEPGGPQPADQLAALHDLGPGRHDGGEMLLGNVVVVPLEPPARDAEPIGEVVELVERAVADDVRPPAPTVPPAGLVDEDGHDP